MFEMACPLYKGGAECREHSEYYVLSEDVIRTLCNGDFRACPDFIAHSKASQLEQDAQSQPKLTGQSLLLARFQEI